MKSAKMAADPELLLSVNKFNNLWCAGMKAHLVMECEKGRAHVQLEQLLRPTHHLGQRDRD
jgi:hypothetical protein